MGNYSSRIMSSMPVEMKTARLNLELSRVFRTKKIKELYKMGYRSVVAYTIRFTPPEDVKTHGQVRESFYTFLAEAKVKHPSCFTEEFGVKVDEGNMALNFIAYDVKWYEDFTDVQEHESLISLSKEWSDNENEYIGGIFIRIGEETDDITEESWGEHDWEWIYLSRQINVDWEEAR
jgi:hypothetical protein